MMNQKLILTYIFVFAAVLIILRAIGFLSFNNYEIFAYVLMIYGLSLFYSSYYNNNKLQLFFGSSIFLIGVILLISGTFELQDTGQIYIPASLFILSISSLMLYTLDKSKKTPIYSAIILFAGGIGAMALVSPYGINNFADNVLLFLGVFWPVLVILLVVILLLNQNSRVQE